MSLSSTPAQARLLRSTSAELPRPLGRPPPPSQPGGGSQVPDPVEAKLNKVEVITAEDALRFVEDVMICLSNGIGTSNVQSVVAKLNRALKTHGAALDLRYKDRMNKLSATFHQACKDERLDKASRLYLLEIIELRTMDWKTNEHVAGYYSQKLSQLGVHDSPAAPPPPPLSPPHNSAPSLKRSASLNVNAPVYTPSPPKPKGTEVAPVGWSSSAAAAASAASADVARVTRRLDFDACGKGANKSVTTKREQDRSGNVISAAGDGKRFVMEVSVGGEIIELAGKNLGLLQSAKHILETHFDANRLGTPPPSRLPPPSTSSSSRSVHIVRPPLPPINNNGGQTVDSLAELIGSRERRICFAETASVKKMRDVMDGKKFVVSEGEDGTNGPGISAKKGFAAGRENNGASIKYTRDELLSLAEAHPNLQPSDWPAVIAEFPVLERRPVCGFPHPIPYDWHATFVDANIAVNGPSIPAEMVKAVPKVASGEAPRKKNFLEVLRPNAPVRSWDEELGEWVERGDMQTRG